MAGDAAAVFRELVETDPVDAESQAGLGEAELAPNHLLEAQAAFREAARLQPGNPQYQARAEFLDEVVSMNPALPGLDAAERYKRSRRLLGTALAAFDQCREEKRRENGAANETAAAASAVLKSLRRPRSLGEATRTDINLAAALWSERGKLCGAPGPKDEALGRAIADASR
jgi:tetratricopeptide (TPR) repeat protein